MKIKQYKKQDGTIVSEHNRTNSSTNIDIKDGVNKFNKNVSFEATIQTNNNLMSGKIGISDAKKLSLDLSVHPINRDIAYDMIGSAGYTQTEDKALQENKKRLRKAFDSIVSPPRTNEKLERKL